MLTKKDVETLKTLQAALKRYIADPNEFAGVPDDAVLYIRGFFSPKKNYIGASYLTQIKTRASEILLQDRWSWQETQNRELAIAFIYAIDVFSQIQGEFFNNETKEYNNKIQPKDWLYLWVVFTMYVIIARACSNLLGAKLQKKYRAVDLMVSSTLALIKVSRKLEEPPKKWDSPNNLKVNPDQAYLGLYDEKYGEIDLSGANHVLKKFFNSIPIKLFFLAAFSVALLFPEDGGSYKNVPEVILDGLRNAKTWITLPADWVFYILENTFPDPISVDFPETPEINSNESDKGSESNSGEAPSNSPRREESDKESKYRSEEDASNSPSSEESIEDLDYFFNKEDMLKPRAIESEEDEDEVNMAIGRGCGCCSDSDSDEEVSVSIGGFSF